MDGIINTWETKNVYTIAVSIVDDRIKLLLIHEKFNWGESGMSSFLFSRAQQNALSQFTTSFLPLMSHNHELWHDESWGIDLWNVLPSSSNGTSETFARNQAAICCTTLHLPMTCEKEKFVCYIFNGSGDNMILTHSWTIANFLLCENYTSVTLWNTSINT